MSRSPRQLPTPPLTVAAADLAEYLPDLRHAGEVLRRETRRLEDRMEMCGAEQCRDTLERLADLSQLVVACMDESEER